MSKEESNHQNDSRSVAPADKRGKRIKVPSVKAAANRLLDVLIGTVFILAGFYLIVVVAMPLATDEAYGNLTMMPPVAIIPCTFVVTGFVLFGWRLVFRRSRQGRAQGR